MSFTPFIKPYPDGYIDGEAGNTPVTAEILNTNYDGFLLALNNWASDAEKDIGDAKTDITGLQGSISSIQSTLNNKVDTSTFNQLGDAVRQIGLAVNSKSTVSISDLLQSGTKVATLTIDGTQYDLYAPSGGGGGSSVSWNQTVSTGTKIATVTIDGVPTDVYVPTPIDELSNLTDVSITNLQDGQIIKWNSTTSKWENSNESGGGTGGHTIIDENGNSMTARAGLQFVGANVDDDATNNKTIVDVASAGGIDGVFVDTENVIVPETTYSGSLSYTATEDCVVFVNVLATSSGSGWVYIDNKLVGRVYFAGSVIINGAYYLLKKGQTLTASSQTYSGIDITYAVYGIQTGTTHSKFQPVIYSLEEREIGVWTDGRPLYEKTVDCGTLPNNTTKNVAHSISNIDKIIGFDGWATDGTNFHKLPIVNQAQANLQVACYCNNTNIVFSSGYDYSSWTVCFITLYYTKTTDVAGSGSWTPQGVPTHHYLTDEQIVGTWIDGKTLYEKTIDFGAIPNNTTKSVAHGINNLSMVVSWNGCMKSSDSFETVPSGENSNFRLTADATNISIRTSTSWNDWTVSYITLQYTKSS